MSRFSFLLVPFNWDTGIRANNFQELMLFVLLPVLIFESALSLDSKLLRKYMPNVLTLATLGLLLSTAITGAFLFFGINHVGFPIIAALLAGAVISATDPVAVVAQLKVLKAPEDLAILIEGESLLNDATAIVLFSILLAIAKGTAEPNLVAGISQFMLVFLGGVLSGVISGLTAVCFLRLIKINTMHLTATTLVLAYGSFYISEHVLHLSGIVAVMSAALTLKHFKSVLTEEHEHQVHSVWESLGFIANLFVFVLLGLVISIEMFTQMWLAILLAIIGATIARVIAVYVSVGLNQWLWGQPTNKKYPPVMIWGGLRGAVTIALVLSLPTEIPYWWTIQSIGFGVVIFTLVLQATTTTSLMKKLKI
ncbi:sodium:proton antiporter [Alteromonadaceae bacterium M269]|nr:sodium:proton antiporter [Alteromonadaceae bacterium M269]